MVAAKTSVGKRSLHLRLIAFGFKYGAPRDADVIFDARSLPNPFYVDALRPLTGADAPVEAYLDGLPECALWLQRAGGELEDLIAKLSADRVPALTVAIGCTGGRHRSVYLASKLATRFGERGDVEIALEPRDVQRAVDGEPT